MTCYMFRLTVAQLNFRFGGVRSAIYSFDVSRLAM